MQTRTLTIVFTDIKGFTERTAAADRAFVLRLMETHDRLLKPIIRQYGGTLVKTIGDAYLLTFDSPTNAVHCAILMQETLHDHNATVPAEERIEIRVAINTGEVNLVGNDILGEAVNVASRVESVTEPNEIWFTEATYLAMNKQEVPNSLVGEFRLKGVPEALRVYRVVLDRESEIFRTLVVNLKRRTDAADPAPSASPARQARMGFAIALMLFVLTAAGALWVARHQATARLAAAERHLAAGKFRAALQEAEEALRDRPQSAEAAALLSRVVAASVTDHLSRDEVDPAEALHADIFARHPALDPLPEVECAVALARATAMIRSGRHREVAEFLEKLVVRHRRRPETVFAVGAFFNRTSIDWTAIVRYLHEASTLAPERYAAAPETVEGMTYFLRKVLPSDGYAAIRDHLATAEFDRYRALLESGLSDDSSETRALRRNALYIFRKRELPVDAAAVHRAELFVSPGDPKEPEFEESMAFYRDLASAGKPLPLPEPLAAFPLYDRYLLPGDSPVHAFVAGTLGEAARPMLLAFLVDPGNASRRLHARMALARMGELPAGLLWRHHAANIVDREGIFRFGTPERPRLVEALDHLVAAAPPAEAGPAEVAPVAAACTAFAREAAEVIEEDREKEKQYRRSPEFWERIASTAAAAANRLKTN